MAILPATPSGSLGLAEKLEALRRIALAVVRPSGASEPAFLHELLSELCAALPSDGALVAVFADEERSRLRTLAVRLDGAAFPDFEYPVRGSPCEQVVGSRFRFMPSGVLGFVDPTSPFAQAGLDAYAAFPLNDSRGAPIGVLAAVSRSGVAGNDADHAEVVLKVVAGRLAGELERRQAEGQLRASEEQHRTIFNASVDGMLVKDAANRIVDVNEAYLRMHGFGREELVGQCLIDFLPPHAREECTLLLRSVPCHFETLTWRRDRSLMDVEVHAVPAVYGGETRALVIMRDITERKAAEAQLRESESQYRAIFNASADALILWDRNYRRVDVNSVYERQYGWTRDEVVGRGFEVYSDAPAHVGPRLDLLARSLAGESCHVELEGESRDGRRLISEIRTVPFQHRGEAHVLAISRDVTEHRRAEAELRRSEAQYRAIFNAAEDAMVLWNDQLVRVDVNAAHERLYGFTREEALGRAYEHLPYDPAHAQARLDLVRRAMAGEACRAEISALRKDGTSVLTELRAIPFEHRGERHVLTIARDISERRKAESALRAREQLHRALFDTSVDAIALFDRAKRLVDVNPAFARIRGLTREDLVGRAWPKRDIPGKDVVEKLVERALEGHEASTVMSVLHQGDGEHIDMELRYLPVRLDGEPFALGIGRNVTERLALESQLRQAQKMEAIGQLTGGIAHDFNNILTSVLGYVTMAEERAECGTDHRLVHHLGQARVAAQRAGALVAQMLAFARRKGGVRRTLAPGPMVREAVDMLRSTLPSSILLEAEGLGEDLPPIEADAVQAGQVLMNLVINARDALDGAGRIRVRVRVQEPGTRSRAVTHCASCGQAIARRRWVVIEVADNGSGIPPEVLPRMFDPFFSTKPVGRGTGMGLAMVHGIVHEHGGHLGVQTWPGEGSLFGVYLPVSAQASAADAPQAMHTSGQRGLAPAFRGRVLLVEDDPQAGDFLRDRLQSWGVDVVLCRDPRHAQDIVADASQALDLLVTDLTMPRVSGLQLAREASLHRPALPVLLVSGDLGGADESALRAVGVRFTLAKPVDLQALREVLAQALA